MPELIEHGVSGFLVADEAEAVTAAARLRILDRMAVRSCAERFSQARVVEAYLSAYQTIVSG